MIIETIIFVFLSVLNGLLSILLVPINALVSTFLPDFNSNLVLITDFFDSLSGTLAYAFSWTMLPTTVLTAVLGYWAFTTSAVVSLYLIRFFIKWIPKLKVW